MAAASGVRLDIPNPVLRALVGKCAAQAGLRVLEAEEQTPPALLVVQARGEAADLERRVDALRLNNQQAAIFLLGDAADTALLRAGMHVGARQFLPEAAGEEELSPYFEDFVAGMRSGQAQEEASGGKLISVLSLKGGVGGTTLAVNVAHELQRLGAAGPSGAALIDLGLPYGEAQMFLDLDCRHHWGDAVKNLSRLDATYLQSIMTAHSSGLRLLPPPPQPEDTQLVGAEVMAFLVEQARAAYGVVVVDLGAFVDEVSQRIMDVSDHVLLVCVQSTACLRNLGRVMGLFPQDKAGARLRLVVNRHLPKFSLGAAELLEASGLKECALISNDFQATLGAINQGLPLEHAAPKSAVTKEIRALAQALAGNSVQTTAPGRAKTRRFALPWAS